MTTRTRFFKFRLTDKEKQAIEDKAARADLSPSDFIRREVGLRVLRPPASRPTDLPERNPGATSLQRLGLTSASDSDQGKAA